MCFGVANFRDEKYGPIFRRMKSLGASHSSYHSSVSPLRKRSASLASRPCLTVVEHDGVPLDERGLDVHAEPRVVDEEFVEPPRRHALHLDDEAADGLVSRKIVVDAETFPERAGQADVLAEERRRPAPLGFGPRRRLARAERAARRRR